MVVVSSLGLVVCLLKMVGQVGNFLSIVIVITSASLDMKKGQLYCNYFLRKIQISRFLQEVEGKLREDKIKALVRERFLNFSYLNNYVFSQITIYVNLRCDYAILFLIQKKILCLFRKTLDEDVLKCRSFASEINQLSEKLKISRVELAMT